MDDKGPCEYCGRPGPRRAGAEDGLKDDLHVCSQCWKLLQSPATAVPLLRGHLSLEMRGVVKPKAAGSMVSSFIERVREWRPRPKSS
jgi:hypothetical protein